MKFSDEKIITHDFPVWRDKSDFIIGAILEDGISDLAEMEQIWAKQIDENLFEICCIPFFVYGLALGYRVSTKQIGNKKYVIDQVIEKNSHVTYRIYFKETERWTEVIDEVGLLGCFVESRWNKSKVISIDSPDNETTTRLEAYLSILVKDKDISCEFGM